jgi:hypothetical protein
MLFILLSATSSLIKVHIWLLTFSDPVFVHILCLHYFIHYYLTDPDSFFCPRSWYSFPIADSDIFLYHWPWYLPLSLTSTSSSITDSDIFLYHWPWYLPLSLTLISSSIIDPDIFLYHWLLYISYYGSCLARSNDLRKTWVYQTWVRLLNPFLIRCLTSLIYIPVHLYMSKAFNILLDTW